MKYFITGATEFIGGVLAKQLRAAGYEVHSSVWSPEKAKELHELGYNPRPLREGWKETLNHEMKLLDMD